MSKKGKAKPRDELDQLLHFGQAVLDKQEKSDSEQIRQIMNCVRKLSTKGQSQLRTKLVCIELERRSRGG